MHSAGHLIFFVVFARAETYGAASRRRRRRDERRGEGKKICMSDVIGVATPLGRRSFRIYRSVVAAAAVGEVWVTEFFFVYRVFLGPVGFVPSLDGFLLGLLGFTEVYWVILWVYCFLTEFYWVLTGFTGFYRVWLGFYRVWLGSYWLYWVLTELFWVLLGLLGFTKFFLGFYWV